MNNFYPVFKDNKKCLNTLNVIINPLKIKVEVSEKFMFIL